ncbi:hypothetical protein HanRHA438_Chr15g0729601 [Helianthus annuus]|nr:hypothetical protein HanIR_Chr15g0780581 [Helianthus annuus]KAJ0846854.1 hypothetical protein HanRHA438_Chr15g0729601 [Helianthus annuus]
MTITRLLFRKKTQSINDVWSSKLITFAPITLTQKSSGDQSLLPHVIIDANFIHGIH